MNDVVRDDLDAGEPLMRGPLHQLVLPHPDVAVGVAAPPAERTDEVLEKTLRVPVVRLEEEQLATGLEQSVERRQGLRVETVTQDHRPDHVIEGPRRKISQIGDVNELGV